MKIEIPDSLVEKMALNAIENYVNETKPRLTFEEKEARRVLMEWRERV